MLLWLSSGSGYCVVGVVEGLDDQGVELYGGVALGPSEDVEVGLCPATGPFGDVGLGAGVAEQPVDRDQVQRGVGLAVPAAGEAEPAPAPPSCSPPTDERGTCGPAVPTPGQST
jgi:hypothetical protein